MADPASELGFLVSVVGFLITIIVVLRSKSAAEKTGEAVAEVRQKLSEIESIVEKALATREAPTAPPSLNRIAAEQGDKLNDIVIAVQQTIGGAKA